MRQVVIGFDQEGKPCVLSAPKKIQVIFKSPKPRTLKKRIKTWLYQIQSCFR